MAIRSGYCNLPLHTGKAPRWLFGRMKKLGGVISKIIIDEYGLDEYLKRLSDPYFFQALSCVLGFDWHSSGTTTTTCGALKESLNKLNLGIAIAGGKGKTSRKTPTEIENTTLSLTTKKVEKLKYASKIIAKVDSALIQDSYNLYHHSFIFTEKGKYCVIQQGINEHYARRYHWLSDNVKEFIEEPHSAICCDKKEKKVLNMTAKESRENRDVCVDLVKDNPKHLEKYIKKPFQKTINDFTDRKPEEFTMTPRHTMVDMNKRNIETLKKAYEFQPKNYEELVALRGIGPKTIRSLALIADLIYGKKPSWRDPVKYSFAHGGKDKIPYEISKKHYDSTTNILKSAIDNAKLGDKDKLYAIKRLNHVFKY